MDGGLMVKIVPALILLVALIVLLIAIRMQG